jgi:hypothetical protein
MKFYTDLKLTENDYIDNFILLKKKIQNCIELISIVLNPVNNLRLKYRSLKFTISLYTTTFFSIRFYLVIPTKIQ